MNITTPESAELIENLRIAYRGECDAQARYIAFARKAEEDGWPGAASLLRAIAAAEAIHGANHGRILRMIDEGNREHTPAVAEVHSTLQNLRTSLAGELYEIDTMYPAFLQQAREIRDVAVVRTLHWAIEAEKTHARLINEALTLVEFNDRESWATMARPFYICPVCGYTSEVRDEQPMCPVCNCSWQRFEEHK